MRTEKIVSVSENHSPNIITVIVSVVTTMSISSGLMLMLGTAFELDFDWVSVLAISFVTSLAFAAAFYLNQKKINIGALIAAPSIFAFLLITNLFKVRTGLLGFCYYVKLYAFYWFPGTYDSASGEKTSVFALLASYNLIATCCTTYFLMKRKFIPAGLLAHLPVFLCSVANLMMIPKMVPCLIAGTGIILLLFAYAFRNKSRTVAEKALLILIVPVIMFTVLMGMIFPEDKYNKDELAKDILISMQQKADQTFGSGNELSRMLDNAINGFKNPYFEETFDMFSPLYSSSTNLERIGPFNPTDTEVLQVHRTRNLDYNGPLVMDHTIYLKVESFDTYENNTLKSKPVKNNVYKNNYWVMYQEAPCYVEITPVGYSSIDVVPYYTDFYNDGTTEYSNVNPFNNTHGGQTGFAASPLPVQTGNIYSDQYLNSYVYNTCLKVPYGTKSALMMSDALPDWYLDVYHGYTEMSDIEKVRRVTEFVSQLHPYDRNTAYPPDDVDFVAWFVNDAESGICVHYAVTSMVLLRMIGVPTRYVRGYVDSGSYNDSTSIVTAEQAHAWFEFFIPEYGWVMGDATPGCAVDAGHYNIDALARSYPELENSDFRPVENVEPTQTSNTETEPSDTSEEETTETTEETTETTETEATEPGSTPTPVPTAVPTTPDGETPPPVTIEFTGTDPSGVDDDYVSPAEQKIKEVEKITLTVLLTLLIVLVSLIVLVMGLRLIFFIYWHNKFNAEKNSEKAIAYYHYYCFMGRVLRFTIPRKAVEIAEKAAFAEDELSVGEIKMLHTSCREHMIECSKSYPKIKKLLFRLLLINI